MQRLCSSCGQDPGTGNFCQHCGTRLTDQGDVPAPEEAGQPAPPPQPPAAPPPQPAATPPILPGGQVPAKRRGCSTGCLIAAVAVVAVVAIGAFIAWRFIESQVLPTIQGVEEVVDDFGTVAMVPGPPGPCYDLEVEAGLVTGWAEVSCDGPRDVEAFFWAEFNDEPFPGDEYLADAAADTCTEAFAVYVGTTVGQSRYDLDWLVPSADTWADGDREAVCLVVSDTGSPLTGTVKGSAA